MHKYECTQCNYTTDRLYNLDLHKKSKKHKNNVQYQFRVSQELATVSQELAGQNSNEVANENENVLTCQFCFRLFKHKSSLSKHQKYRCKEKDSNNKLRDENEELKKQNRTITEEKNKLIDLATSNSDVAKKSMSIMTYALKHFNDAPPIGLLEDEQFNKMSNLLIYDDNGKKKTNKSIEEIIIFHHKQNTLNKIIGDLIVGVYKKNDPKKQSTWSSDVSRLTFIVRDIVGKGNKSKWIMDKKGIHITQTIINPLMDKIKVSLSDYITKCGKKINRITSKSILSDDEENITKELLLKMQEANLTLLTIKLAKIHSEILKYIAPFFNLNIDDHSKNSDSDSESSDISAENL
jgi:hypothetical protein